MSYGFAECKTADQSSKNDSTTVTNPSESEDKPAGLGAAALQQTTTLLTLAVTQDQAPQSVLSLLRQ